MQTKLLPPGGNCFAACVASILELDLADVPAVEFEKVNGSPDDPDAVRFWRTWRNWLAEIGFGRACIGATRDDGVLFEPDGYAILTGKSPRGEWNHSVVCFNGQLRHDPYPDGDGVRAPYVAWEILYPHSPADGLDLEKVAAGRRYLAQIKESPR
jgi:hypothetical protein